MTRARPLGSPPPAPDALTDERVSRRELARRGVDQLDALRAVYDVHRARRGWGGLLGASCSAGCSGPWPCRTRQITADALELPRGEQ